MKFDDLDARMRVYETEHDRCVPPEIFMVARLDGRGFTRLTKEILDLEAPFDVRLRDQMLATVEHLMDCGFAVLYGYADTLRKMSSADKRTLLTGFGIDFDALPSWQRHGAGVLWEAYEKPGRNPVTGETVAAVRHRLTRHLELPNGGAYGGWIESLLAGVLSTAK